MCTAWYTDIKISHSSWKHLKVYKIEEDHQGGKKVKFNTHLYWDSNSLTVKKVTHSMEEYWMGIPYCSCSWSIMKICGSEFTHYFQNMRINFVANVVRYYWWGWCVDCWYLSSTCEWMSVNGVFHTVIILFLIDILHYLPVNLHMAKPVVLMRDGDVIFYCMPI